MSYHRVIPRDFFNEAKLLKCLGKVQLCILDNTFPREFNWGKITVDYDGSPFDIFQNPNDGALSVLNYQVFIDNELLQLYVPYNSKDDWPLVANYKGAEYYMFDKKGNWIPNFGVIRAVK